MPHVKAAFEKMEELIPLFKGVGAKSLLYVGWRHDCHPWWYRKFAPSLGIQKIGIVEVFPPNIADARQKASDGNFGEPGNVDIYACDIRNILESGLQDYDVIFWDHGPEHVSQADLEKTTPALKGKCKILIYSCPWGSWPQGADGGNEHEKHMWDVEPEVFKNLGMEFCTVGKSGQVNLGEIIAWSIQ